MTAKHPKKLQAPASDTEQHKAGFGGSYVLNPTTGEAVLAGRTDASKPVSTKAPLTNAKGEVVDAKGNATPAGDSAA